MLILGPREFAGARSQLLGGGLLMWEVVPLAGEGLETPIQLEVVEQVLERGRIAGCTREARIFGLEVARRRWRGGGEASEKSRRPKLNSSLATAEDDPAR